MASNYYKLNFQIISSKKIKTIVNLMMSNKLIYINFGIFIDVDQITKLHSTNNTKDMYKEIIKMVKKNRNYKHW